MFTLYNLTGVYRHTCHLTGVYRHTATFTHQVIAFLLKCGREIIRYITVPFIFIKDKSANLT